jgi:hypothetical protein
MNCCEDCSVKMGIEVQLEEIRDTYRSALEHNDPHHRARKSMEAYALLRSLRRKVKNSKIILTQEQKVTVKALSKRILTEGLGVTEGLEAFSDEGDSVND